jgi:UDP-N-acetylmuramate--alanine ligase
MFKNTKRVKVKATMFNSYQLANHIYFIGIAGTGMSALAQYCAGNGKLVSGSDRYFGNAATTEIQTQLEKQGIQCYPQNGMGIAPGIDVVVISTAIEENNPELEKARSLGITILKRAALLAEISNDKKTIAVGGTSGKSTTTAMIFDILEYAGLQPSIISGAGLVRLQEQGLIGNAVAGKGDWLVIEADESDGSIVHYKPEVGLLLNIDKDHKEIAELEALFSIFKQNSHHFIVNQQHPLARLFSDDAEYNFSSGEGPAGFIASNFIQNGLQIQFTVNNYPFTLQAIGKHNMENALAAITVAHYCEVDLQIAAKALQAYKGIYRRNQVIGQKNTVWLIDDYAHNPAKVAAAIAGVQPLTQKVIAWFQPHGYGPTRFLRTDFVEEIARVLRPRDEIWMSEIFYAGGTAIKDISAADLIKDLQAKGCKAFFVEDRNHLANHLQQHLEPNAVVLLMGARDPSLEQFAQQMFQNL